MGSVSLVNARLCINGEFKTDTLVFSTQDGKIQKSGEHIESKVIDMKGKIIAPGFLELQTNGMLGFHFTSFNGDVAQYAARLEEVSKYLVTKGVTAFWATIPTVEKSSWPKILPNLTPRCFGESAELLGAHVEGPYLHPDMKGAHTEGFLLSPQAFSVEETYGENNLRDIVKLVTVAPELPGSREAIRTFKQKYDIRVSMGHSTASFDEGVVAMGEGATAITHMYNAMPAHHRKPGLIGLLAQPEAPYYSLIGDGLHIHPAMLALAYRLNPQRCMLITDSIELLGMPDGIYPGNAQIAHKQEKTGGLVTFYGDPQKTMVGSCCDIQTCVQNLLQASGRTVAEIVRCVTENIASLMGLKDRGMLEEGRRADFVVLDDHARVLETWIRGIKVWQTPG